MMHRIRQSLAIWLVRNLLAPVEETDVLRVVASATGRKVYWQDRELSEQEIASLKSQAETLSEIPLWKLLSDTVRYEAYRKMFYQAKSGDEMLFGRAMLYNKKVENDVLGILKTL